MYEINGVPVTLEQLQQKASELNITFDELLSRNPQIKKVEESRKLTEEEQLDFAFGKPKSNSLNTNLALSDQRKNPYALTQDQVDNGMLPKDESPTYKQKKAQYDIDINKIKENEELKPRQKVEAIRNIKHPNELPTLRFDQPITSNYVGNTVAIDEDDEYNSGYYNKNIDDVIGSVGNENLLQGSLEEADVMSEEQLNIKGGEAYTKLRREDKVIGEKLELYKQLLAPEAEVYKNSLVDSGEYDLTTQEGVDQVQDKVNDFYTGLLEDAMINDPSVRVQSEKIAKAVDSRMENKLETLGRSGYTTYKISDALQGKFNQFGSIGGLAADAVAGTEAFLVGAEDLFSNTPDVIGAQMDGGRVEANKLGLAKLQELRDQGKGDNDQVAIMVPFPMFNTEMRYPNVGTTTIAELEARFNKNIDEGTEDLIENVDQIEKFKNFSELQAKAKFTDGISFRDITVGLGQSLPTMAAASAGTIATVVAPEIMVPLISAFGNIAVGSQFYADNFMSSVEQGIIDNPEKYPGGVNQENLRKALIDGEFNNVAEDAASAAIMSRLEKLGSGASLKSFYKVLKMNPTKGIRSLYKDGIKEYIGKVKDGAIVVGRNGLTEGLTEVGQGAMQQLNQGYKEEGISGVLKYVDKDELAEQGLAGSTIGAVIPFSAQIRNQAGAEYRNLAMKFAERFPMRASKNLVRRQEFFKEISNEVKKKYSDPQGNVIDKLNYQNEIDAISDIRNAGLKIPKGFSQNAREQAMKLMIERSALEKQIEQEDPAYTTDAKEKVLSINKQLAALNFMEGVDVKSRKIAKSLGVDFLEAENDAEVQKILEEKGIDGGKASGDRGTFFTDPNTGKQTIILNKERVTRSRQYFTGAHEILHSILAKSIAKGDEAAFSLANSLKEKLKEVDKRKKGYRQFKKSLEAYDLDKDITDAETAEEVVTLFSEAMEYGLINFDSSTKDKIKDSFRRIAQTIAPKTFGNIKFKNDGDVFNFIKDFNKSMKKGRLTRAQKRAAEKGIDIDERSLETGVEIASGKGRGFYRSEDGKMKLIPEEKSETKPAKDENIDMLINDSSMSQNEKSFFITEEFKDDMEALGKKVWGDNLKYNQNKEDLVNDLLYEKQGVKYLVDSYFSKKENGTLPMEGGKPITLGNFVMGKQAGMPAKVYSIGAKTLGVSEVDPELTSENKKDFSKEEKESLKKSMLELAGETEADVEALASDMADIAKKVLRGKLKPPSSEEFIQDIQKQASDLGFKRMKAFMGKPKSQEYKDFIEKYALAILNKTDQRTLNKRFNKLTEPAPVVEGETGRILAEESRSEGLRVKNPYAGNKRRILKPNLNVNDMVEYFLPDGRRDAKQNTLAEVAVNEFVFDALPESYLQTLEDGTTVADLRGELFGEDVVAAERAYVAHQMLRSPGYKAAKDLGIDDLVLDFFNKGAESKWKGAKWRTEFNRLPVDVKEQMEKSGIDYYISDAVVNFRAPVLGLDWGSLNEYKNLYAATNGSSSPFNKINGGFYTSMKQMASMSEKLMDAYDPVVVSLIGKAGFGIADRALNELKKSEDPKDKEILDKLENKYKSIVSKVTPEAKEKFIKENGFDPNKVKMLNGGKGLFKNIANNILITESDQKQKLIEEKYGKQIDDANNNNVKALAYMYTNMLDVLSDNPADIVGLLRLAESNSNNVNGPRALTYFTSVQAVDGVSQAPFVDPATGKYYRALSEAKDPEIRERLVFNESHPNFKEAIEALDQTLNNYMTAEINKAKRKGEPIKDVTLRKKANDMLYDLLRFKGEHMMASALMNYEAHRSMFDYIERIKQNPRQKEELLKEFNKEFLRLTEDYDQELGAKVLFDIQDRAYGTTSKLAFLRSKVLGILEKQFVNPTTGKSKAETTSDKIKAKLNKDKLQVSMKAAKDLDIDMLKQTRVLDVEEGMTMEEVLGKAASIDKALRVARDPNAPVKKIRVFDFDDTLATSKNKVFATKGKEKITLNAEEFAKDGKRLIDEGYKMDFSDFNNVTDGGRGPLFDIAQKIKEARGNEDLFVLTARAPQAESAIYEFLKSQGLEFKKENIVGLGNSTAAAKANWIIDRAAEGYNDFYFADDAVANFKGVRDALDVIDVKSKVQQAKMKFAKDVDADFNKIIEQKTGIASEKEYSKAKAEVRGANKGKFKFWIPYSAEDFMGLIYPLLSKGELGNNQMAWFKSNLLDPYARAMDSLSRARIQLMADFKTLKKDLQVPKTLAKEAVDGFTNEQAVRVYLWNKQDVSIPGLSKKDTKELVDIVENDSLLKEFADKLLEINKDPYPNPDKSWLVGTITTDLIKGLNTDKRSLLLQDFNENADLIFSEKNMNKLEAAYGKKYREALEGIIQRMKSGKNRLESGNRLSNRVLNYINGSNAAIMFFNTRSAILQTISSINFINWSFNNPLKAGAAFANQPQYWKDFMELMNSDYLKDRRGGLRINITESEIADLAKTTKNKGKAVMAYILEKGYLPTQYADSFAIASGGATFYRNRINDLIKNEGLTEAQAKEKAMTEFRQISEESQQSSNPARISAQQSSDLGRLILMFGNTPMQYARLQKRAAQDLINGRGDSKSNISKIIYYGFIQNIIFNALQQAMFAMGFGDEEEEQDQEKVNNVINGMVDSQLKGLGLGGSAVMIAKNFLMDIYERSGRKRPDYTDSVYELIKFAPPISSKISKIRQAAYPFDSKARRQEIKDKGFSIDNPAFMSFAKVLSATTNIPLDRVLNKMDNIKGAMDEENDWWQRLAMMGGWPKWSLENKTKKKETTTKSRGKSRSKTRYKNGKKVVYKRVQSIN